MAAGVSVAANALNPSCKVIIVEPEGKDLGPCLKTQKRLWPNPPRSVKTIAEGIRTQQLGRLTFPIVCRFAQKGKTFIIYLKCSVYLL